MSNKNILILGAVAVVLYIIYNNMQTVKAVANTIVKPDGTVGLPSITGAGDPGVTQINGGARSSLGGHFG